MNEKKLHENCTPYLVCKDYLVSGESYELLYNQEYDMLVTSPIPSDLNKYYESEEYQSHSDDNSGLFNYIYQTVKQYSFKKKLSLFNTNKSEKKLLDIGAGTGEFLKFCEEYGWNVNGVEPSKKARTIAKEKRIELYEKLNYYSKQSFDVITMWHVLEHVPNLFEEISQIKKILKEDGTLIIAVPNFKSFDAKLYKEHWAAFDVPRHLWHFSQNAINSIFNQYDLEVVKTKPLIFDAFYISMMSEKHKTGKMNFLKSFANGLRSNLKSGKNKEYSSLIYVLKHKNQV